MQSSIFDHKPKQLTENQINYLIESMGKNTKEENINLLAETFNIEPYLVATLYNGFEILGIDKMRETIKECKEQDEQDEQDRINKRYNVYKDGQTYRDDSEEAQELIKKALEEADKSYKEWKEKNDKINEDAAQIKEVEEIKN